MVPMAILVLTFWTRVVEGGTIGWWRFEEGAAGTAATGTGSTGFIRERARRDAFSGATLQYRFAALGSKYRKHAFVTV